MGLNQNELDYESDSEAPDLIPIDEIQLENYIDSLQMIFYDINHKDNNGQTLLHIACIMSDFKLIVLLVENGADINLKDAKGRTPFYYILYYRIGSSNDFISFIDSLKPSFNPFERCVLLAYFCSKKLDLDMTNSIRDEFLRSRREEYLEAIEKYQNRVFLTE